MRQHAEPTFDVEQGEPVPVPAGNTVRMTHPMCSLAMDVVEDDVEAHKRMGWVAAEGVKKE